MIPSETIYDVSRNSVLSTQEVRSVESYKDNNTINTRKILELTSPSLTDGDEIAVAGGASMKIGKQSIAETLGENCRGHNGKIEGVSRLEVINFLAFLNPRKALGMRHLKTSQTKVKAPYPRYPGHACPEIEASRIGPVTIFGRPYSHAYADISPVLWVEHLGNGNGPDMVGLEMRLSSRHFMQAALQSNAPAQQFAASKYVAEDNPESALCRLADRLGIEPLNPQISQKSLKQGWFPSWRSSRSPLIDGSEFEDGSSGLILRSWTRGNITDVPFLGRPRYRFNLHDKNNRVVAVVGYWPTIFAVKPLYLSFSICHREEEPLEQRWMFLRPSVKTQPYGIDMAQKFSEATVLLRDDLAEAEADNVEFTKLAAPTIVSVAWPRGLSGTTPADTIWDALRSRKLICAVSNCRESFEGAITLREELLREGIEGVRFLLPKTFPDGREEIRVSHADCQLMGNDVSGDEFLDIAFNRFGFVAKTADHNGRRKTWQLGDAISSVKSEMLLEPFMTRGTVTIIYSDGGGGKSWFAGLMSYAVASGGSLVNRMQAPVPRKVLYVVSEVMEDQANRIEIIHASIQEPIARENLEIFPNSSEAMHAIMLDSDEGWAEIGHLINDADLIVLDHLSNLTDGSASKESWIRLWKRLSPYKAIGKSFIILNHTTKSGDQLGTVAVRRDVDFIIRMDEHPDAVNGVRISFGKGRDDRSLGKDLMAFNFHWFQKSHGRVIWWSTPVEGGEAKEWMLPPDDLEPVDLHVNERAIDVEILSEEQRTIIRLLVNSYLCGEQGLRTGVVCKNLGVSENTARSVIKKLIELGWVAKAGDGSSTHYRLAEKAITTFLTH